MRKTSAREPSLQCNVICAGWRRAEVPAKSPRTRIVPVDCRSTSAPRLCLQLQLPATWRDLLETPKNSGESEWELVSLNFEIDASFIEQDSLEVIYWRSRGGRPVNG